MRQYAVLRNVVRDVNFGVVVKSDGNLKFFGWSEKAVEWANWANANNANLGQLPPNISVGEFRGMSDEVMKSIILSSEEATAAGSSTIRTKTIAFDAGGERYPNASKFPSFVDSPISGDWIAKNKSINFKAHNFRKEVVQNELALRVRMHELAFNNETKQFVAKPNRITATHTRSEIQKKMSRGAERKFGKKIVEYTNKEILKNYVTPTIKRDVMGKSTKDILDVYTKARLGGAIGRAARGAVRGATPNRRTRGVASRFISGVLDPRKRRDVDGDGMIFDGTWREMPDPTRFIQDPKKPSIDAMRRNRDTIQGAFRRAQGRPSADGEGLRSGGTGLAGLPRGDGRLNLPGGGGVGVRTPGDDDGGVIPLNFNLPKVKDIPGVKTGKNGEYDLSDVDFESLTDDQLKALLQLFPERGPNPLRVGAGRSEFENILSGKKSPRDSIISELRKRGYKVKLGPARKPQFYGDYVSGDRYWNVSKPDATLSTRAQRGQATRARRRRYENGMLRDEEAARLRSGGKDPSYREIMEPSEAREPLLRTARSVRTPLSTRRSMATTERAAKPRGTTLRSSGGGDGKTRTPAPKSTGRGVGAGPGGKAGHSRMTRTYGKDKRGDDGKVFESLTPEQQDAVKKALAEEVKPALDKKLKGFFSKYWNARTKRGSKKQSVVAVRRRAKGDERGRYEKVAEDTPLDSSDIYEMLYRLDGQVAEGLLEKFEVSDKDTRELKLTDDGEAKISTAKNGYTVQQRALDDAQTILNMVETEDFSALEHLHPSTKKKIADVIKKNGGTVPKGWIDSESSVAGWAGGEGRTKAPDAIDLEKERGIGKKKKEKRLSLFQRLRRVDPERERRVELRAARRNRQIGRSGVVLDPKKELKRRKLRAAAMKRSVISKFKKQRNPEVLSDDLGERRNDLHPVQIAPDGSVSLKPEFTKTIAALDVSFRDKNRSLSNDQLLGDLWENLGFSETPVLVTEDEVKSLIAAGWQPIIRGTGHEEVESESYVEQFLTSDGRFIPGRGARAYGVGEYFAYPGGNWDGYSGNPEVDRHSMLVLIPPSATIMTASQVAKEQRAMQEISKKVVDTMKVLGGREATSKMEAGELAAEIRKSAPDIEKGETRSAQIVSRLVERLEELDKLPKNDTTNAEKQEILDTFDYLSRVSKAGESGYFAPIIGVDAIDTNEGGDSGAPMLLHNRSIVAAFQRPMTRNEAEAMSGETRKVWTKWKRKPRIVDADGETQKPRARRRATGSKRTRPSKPDGDGTPDTTNNQSPNAVKAVSTSGWKQSRPSSTGSNPATLLTAPDGTEYYAKLRKQSESVQEAKERMETEVLASELYKLAGIQAADLSIGDDSGEPQMLSRMIQARMPNSPADNDAARDGFVVDAWLANWDAPLNDNIKFDSNGNPVRLDVGGSLDYRAQGARKGQGGATAFGDTVGEITSMQKSGTYNFTNMDPKEIRRQAQKLSTVTDADIRSTVSKIVSDPQRAAKLAQTLINRRNDIVSNYG